MKLNYKIYLVSMLCCAFFTKATAQEHRVEGRVTDSTQNPIPGVNLQLQHFTRGTTTNFDGEFSLNANTTDTLIISYLGFKTQRVPIGSRNFLEIALTPEANALKDVVINAGYYNTTERERTGSISKVTAKEIENQPLVSPLEALQGRVAGVSIVQKTGVPGAAPVIRIRGQNSLRNSFGDNGNLPLYIIDGVPINSNPLTSINQFSSSNGVDPLNTLNLSNIESIEVLKDADATAIYGSRGANGVILITTKSGNLRPQKTKVEARFYSGVSRVAHTVDLLNTSQYLALRREAFENDGVEPNEFNAKDLVLWDQERDTNWQKKLFGGTALTTDANLSVSGGNENTSFLIGGSYHKQGSVFPGDYNYRKLTLGLNLNHRSKNKKFQMNLSANYGIDHNDLFNSDNFVSNAFTLPPNAPAIYDEKGKLNWENSTWANPLAATNGDAKANVNNLITNLGLRYNLARGLQFKTNLGYTYLDSKEKIKKPIQTYDPALWDRVSNISQHSFSTRKSWIVEPQLDYTYSLGNSNLDALIGATFQENDNTSLRIIGTGYSDEHLIGNLAAADAVTVNDHNNSVYKYNALFARLGYNWKHTYFVNLTGRRDGSSRFGPDNRFANFGAVGTAWIFTREAFVKNNLPWLSFGKLRGSYGITGSDQVGDYRYLDAYEATPGPNGLYPTQLTNPDFSWETNKKLETALELGFLKDRINLSLNWYQNRSSNQLVGYPLPSMTGFTSVEANLPATVQNTGWEIDFSTVNLKTERFTWKSFLNITIPENKLLNFPNIEETSYRNIYRVGEPLSLAILYNFEGIDPETGLYAITDVNEDGSYDYDDKIVTKNLGRKYYGGLQNQFTYKNFSLGFLLEFVKQQGYKISDTPPGRLGNSLQEHANVWQDESDNSNIQGASQSIYALLAYNHALSSDFAVTDASYIRLKTLNFGYSLPKKFLKGTGLSSFKLFLHAQNLFTLTNYVGLDPQNPGERVLPALQSFTGGLQFNF